MKKNNTITTELVVASGGFAVWVSIGTFVMYKLESWTIIQSFYFSVVTLTTVGYGDFVPTTDASRLFVAFYIIVGVSIGLSALGILGRAFLSQSQRSISARRNGRK